MGKQSDRVSALVFLDLSKDESFSEAQREVFRKIAFARGAAKIDIEPAPRRQKRRRRR